MTSSEQRIENVPAVPHNVPDGWDVSPDYLESETSQPSRRLVISGGRTGRTDGVPRMGVTDHSRPTRDVHKVDFPHVLLSANEASQLLRLVTQSRPMDCGQMELVSNLARHVAAARGIEVRHGS